MRITARARTLADVTALLDKEEVEVRRAIIERLGDIVFGVDDESMEVAVANRLVARGLRFGVAESLTGGLIASRLVNVPGASEWFRGGVVAYASDVKFDVLGVPVGPVVTEAAAAAMAEGARKVTGADVGLGITGVAGPDDQEGVRPGHLFVGSPCPGDPSRPAGSGCPGTANGSASTGRSPPLTCCDTPSTPCPPDLAAHGRRAHRRPTAGSHWTGFVGASVGREV